MATRARVGGVIGIWVLAVLVAVLPCAALAADAPIDPATALKVIADAANEICGANSLATGHAAKPYSVELSAEVNRLTDKLAQIGALESGVFTNETYLGILRCDVGSIMGDHDCKMKVFNLLSAKLLTPSQSSSGNLSPVVSGTGGHVTISVGPVPPPPDSPSISLSDVDSALGKLVDGNIAFNAPDHAIIGKSQIVESKLSVTLTPSELIAALTGPGKRESATLRVGDRMTATLSGGAAFDISPSGPQSQLISHKDTTTWIWTITPKQAGQQFLILSFDAIVSVDGKDGNRNVNTLRREINVDVGWPESISEWIDYGRKLFDGISWLWVTVLIPIGVYIRHLWNVKQGKAEADSSKVEPESDVQKS